MIDCVLFLLISYIIINLFLFLDGFNYNYYEKNYYYNNYIFNVVVVKINILDYRELSIINSYKDLSFQQLTKYLLKSIGVYILNE